MRFDPSRRFALGFTIENTNMRLWFCDRVQPLVSEAFNFITVSSNMSSHTQRLISRFSTPSQEQEIFIHFFLSLIYADFDQLGWDPTIRAYDDHRYEITVHCDEGRSKVYRTRELLSEIGAIDMIGKGTRVWSTVELKDGEECGEEVVLKDGWVDCERTPKGIITEEVHNADRGLHQGASDHGPFPTVICHGDVFVDKDRTQIDCTRFRVGEDGLVTSFLSLPDLPGRDEARKRPSGHKVHYRIVFKDVCAPMSDETSVTVIFRALSNITHGRCHCHCIGIRS